MRSIGCLKTLAIAMRHRLGFELTPVARLVWSTAGLPERRTQTHNARISTFQVTAIPANFPDDEPMIKSAFISLYLSLAVALTGYSIFELLRGAPPLGWIGVLLTTAPFLTLLFWIMATQSIARTSTRFPGMLILATLGVALALWSWRAVGASLLAPLLAVMGLCGFLLYVFWYSSLGPRQSGAIAAGQKLPAFTVRDIGGAPVSSEQWIGRPMILIFFRGNWCPLCMAQIKELAVQYRQIEAMGARTALVSPQPHDNTIALAKRHGVHFEFYADPANRAARILGIDHPGGLPMGMQTMGYDTDTVLPTVIITNAKGVVVWSHETDNYRVRPDPGVYLEVLRAASLSAPEAS